MNPSWTVTILALVVGGLLMAAALWSAAGRDDPEPRTGDIVALPGWACREIVDLRHQKVQLVREVARAYEGGKPKVLVTFELGDRRACRR